MLSSTAGANPVRWMRRAAGLCRPRNLFWQHFPPWKHFS
jgi:hypothetical protein